MAGVLMWLSRLSRPLSKGHWAQTPAAFLAHRYPKGTGAIVLVWVLALALGLPVTGLTADLPDPTRPPAAFTAPPPDKAAAKAPEVVNALYLSGKKPYALVDGIALHVGDPLGEGKVTRIDEAGVWLKEPTGERVLRLLPGVEKTVSDTPDQAGRPKAGAQNAENKARAIPRARTRRSQ